VTVQEMELHEQGIGVGVWPKRPEWAVGLEQIKV
jgi:hypothetical protein